MGTAQSRDAGGDGDAISIKAFTKGRRRALGSPWPSDLEKAAEPGGLHNTPAYPAQIEWEARGLRCVPAFCDVPDKEGPDALTGSISMPDLAAWHEPPASALACAAPSLSALLPLARTGQMPGRNTAGPCLAQASVLYGSTEGSTSKPDHPLILPPACLQGGLGGRQALESPSSPPPLGKPQQRSASAGTAKPSASYRGKTRSLEAPRAAGVTARRALSEDLGCLPEAAPAAPCNSAEPACEGGWDGGSLDLLLLLGRGSFGCVYLGMYRAGATGPKSQVAVKVIQDCASLRMQAGQPLEAVITSGLAHANVVRVLAHSWHSWHPQPLAPSVTAMQRRQSTTNLWDSAHSEAVLHGPGSGGSESLRLIMEYCQHGTLQAAIKKRWFLQRPCDSGSPPHVAAMLAVLCEVAQGMAYLHANSIIHGDLNASNVLLVGSPALPNGFSAKVADFGLARCMADRSRTESSTYGTATHQPPETLAAGVISKATDVYAFGVLIWEVYTGCRAWEGMRAFQVIMAVVIERQRLQPLQGAPPALAAMVDACTHPQPECRPTFAALATALAQLRAAHASS